MTVREIRDAAELNALQPAWNELLRASASNSLFLTWEWVASWWAGYGKTNHLRVLTAFDERGILRGIAPFQSKTVRRYGQNFEVLAFAVDGSNDSDYLDLIIAPGYESAVVAEFRNHLQPDLDHGVVLLLNEIPEASPNRAIFRQWAEEKKLLFAETDVPCGSVSLPETWDEYITTLRSRFRTKVRSVLRELEANPDVKFGFCSVPEELEAMLPTLFDLHTRRWATEGKPGVFGWDQKRDFYAAMAPLMLDRGWLRLSWLSWRGKILACQLGFAYDGKYLLLQEGYEPESEHLNLGVGLRAWSIREFLKQGIREYDFLAGRVLRHRSDWGAATKFSKQISIAESTPKNRLFFYGPEWESALRDSVKRLIPERVLAVRKQRLERAASNQDIAPATGRFQKTVAQCYYNLHLPALARPLRERYRLAVSSGRGVPGISLRRRTEPAARILYYHGVNNDVGPFSSAISIQRFEQEMRFVAKHYRVVSLRELVNHLDSDSPEMVVAITFDDGYKDNYENAFPILQRYQVPATIFLTTGALDSGEPLWFERLAQSLRRASVESIDLDIDIPRRFFLRTETERIEANGKIYGLLRAMSDSDLRDWLTRILQKLRAAGDEAPRNQMLTWDQVRSMNRRGIDFGGHTVTHPFISRLERPQVAWELSECKRRIEEELQSPVDLFAYPSGREQDFGKWNKDLVRNAGYRAAVTTIWGMNDRSTDRMELRRGGPWEETAAEFATKLDWYQLVNG
jgi:peptidoglycan/xylan/chitin deacetylase (PgdA/CDA1 family)/CelD/BcsL family acetyltransferase involved in cellulose biosynthesis